VTAGAELAKAEQYRHYAAECLKLLPRLSDAGVRAMFSQMAASWVKLAEHAERNAEADFPDHDDENSAPP
jgi:hypothetical protein